MAPAKSDQRIGVLMAAASLALGGANELCQRMVQRSILEYHNYKKYVDLRIVINPEWIIIKGAMQPL